MLALFHRLELIPLLMAADGFGLPDPKTFPVIGWAVVITVGMIKGADIVLNFYKRHIKQSIPSGDWASQKDLDNLKTDVHNQLREGRDYVHKELHELRDALQAIQTSGETGREGLHNRLSTIVELVHYQRGQNEGLLKASEVTTTAAIRASKSADDAVARAEELIRRIPLPR